MLIGGVRGFLVLSAIFLCSAYPISFIAHAQDAKTSSLASKEELDQLLAPIALYPDDLLTNILVASTYPLEVVRATRWKREAANANLTSDALAKALEAQDWDPSIKALVQFPHVLQQMNDKLDWTQKLGDAFLAQQGEVMDEIQLLRAKADEAGNLKNNDQQTVSKQASAGSAPVYVIQPARADVVYVPVYEPAVVYGSWWYPSYPPYYWPRPGATLVNGFFWGAGIAISNSIWGWGHCDWGGHDIDINVNKWNNINVNRPQITANKWEHNPVHRGAVPYKNKSVHDKFKGADRGVTGDNEFRGHQQGDIDRSKIEGKLKGTDRAKIKEKVGDGAGQKIKDRAGGGQKIKNRGVERQSGAGQKISRGSDRPKPKMSSQRAPKVKRAADVKRHAARGHASRGGGHRGGGGRRR